MAKTSKKQADWQKTLEKHRRDFALLECGQGKHVWSGSTSDGWRVCPICKAIERGGQIIPAIKPLRTLPPDQPGEMQQASLF